MVVILVVHAVAVDVHHVANGARPARGRVGRAACSPCAGARPLAFAVLVSAAGHLKNNHTYAEEVDVHILIFMR